MLPGAEIQVPFLADLVTLADPTSPYSFLNYLHEQGRLYRFYFHERFHVLRREYEAYCRWVAARLPSCRFAHRVDAIRPADGRLGGVVARASSTAREQSCSASAACRSCRSARAGSRTPRRTWPSAIGRSAARSVAVIGSGQSAAEIFADLLEHATGRVDWFTRSSGFLPMEYSKLGLEHFSPEYTAYFHALPEERRDALRANQVAALQGHRRRHERAHLRPAVPPQRRRVRTKRAATRRAASCAASRAATACTCTSSTRTSPSRTTPTS